MYHLRDVLTYNLPWNRFSSERTLQGGELVEEITYRINADFSEKNSVQATIYLESQAINKKLDKGSTLMVNGQIIEPMYYNIGEASGYKYSAIIPRNKEYTLIIRREGKEDLKKVITSKTFAVSLPEKISKSKLFSLSYTADKIPLEAEPNVWLESPTKEPILVNDQYKFGLHLSTKVAGEKIVMDETSVLAQEQKRDFRNLKNGLIILSVGAHFEQPDGILVISKEQEVEVVD